MFKSYLLADKLNYVYGSLLDCLHCQFLSLLECLFESTLHIESSLGIVVSLSFQ